MKRALIIALWAAMAAAAFAFPRIAHGDKVPATGYDIEVLMLSCINPSQPCNTLPTLTNSKYAQAEAVSFHPGAMSGTPDAVDFTCGKVGFDPATHRPYLITMHVFASDSLTPRKDGYDPGTLHGTASLGPNPTEQNTAAMSTIHVRAFDARTGDRAVVNGQMVSNNVTDMRVSGGFTIHIMGPIYREAPGGPGGPPPVRIGRGQMWCNTIKPFVRAPHVSGPFFEGVLGNTDDKQDSK